MNTRNLTPKGRDLLIYELVEARKKSVGAPIGNKNNNAKAKSQLDQSGQIDFAGSTRRAVAKELGVGRFAQTGKIIFVPLDKLEQTCYIMIVVEAGFETALVSVSAG
ncbi:MAG: hypothetical protein IJU35_08295 [Paludibacteraceae bacterium]|nr:hypothetical protein [Paludibacteraceae bacterium]